MGRDRLRPGEPPNPTPAFVRASRRVHEAAVSLASGANPELVASEHGYRDGEAVSRAVMRARDRVFPFDVFESLAVERRVIEALTGAVMCWVHPGVSDRRLLPASGIVIRAGRLAASLGDTRIEAKKAAQDPDWAALWEADLGVWTPSLTMRADGRSVHEIAAEFGFVDSLDANRLVATDLIRYEHGCISRLRRAQVAHLDGRLRSVWGPATRTGSPDLRASRQALSIVEQRHRVRGLRLTFTGPLIEHAPEPRRALR
ncbi:MAG: hypothetical protein K1X38_17865 [Microthrixaceae bacterium]|nr:hypothetical protein [Microthrixaceae bacterium]